MCIIQAEASLSRFHIKVEATSESRFDGRACQAHEPGWKSYIAPGNGAPRGPGARRLHHDLGPHSGESPCGTQFRETTTPWMRLGTTQTYMSPLRWDTPGARARN